MNLTDPESRRFPVRKIYLVFPFAIAGAGLAATGWLAPLALLLGIPVFGVILTLVSLGNCGVILSPAGLECYALRPRWRFRKVPWDAVLDVRRDFFGLSRNIRLIVRSGRYEPWVWGMPRPGARQDILISPIVLVHGDELLGAIRAWLARRDEVIRTT